MRTFLCVLSLCHRSCIDNLSGHCTSTKVRVVNSTITFFFREIEITGILSLGFMQFTGKAKSWDPF